VESLDDARVRPEWVLKPEYVPRPDRPREEASAGWSEPNKGDFTVLEGGFHAAARDSQLSDSLEEMRKRKREPHDREFPLLLKLRAR